MLLGYPANTLKESDINQYFLLDSSDLQSYMNGDRQDSSLRGIREYLNHSSGLKRQIYYVIQPHFDGKRADIRVPDYCGRTLP